MFLLLYMLRISSGSCSSSLSSPSNPLGQPPAPVLLLELPSTENAEEEPKGRGGNWEGRLRFKGSWLSFQSRSPQGPI